MGRLATIPCPLGDKTDREVWKVEERRMQIKCDVRGTTLGWATRYKALYYPLCISFLLYRWNKPTSFTATTQ